ncbi:hypothetical protein DSO57_1021414 [Entomophthora muscae]|uniref:Uncharacterized protein n=1 Tax=Entomophthora muscae TaxID=34485 RepID=A0ACC2SG71_9FUNG|nr:hypothetical protein DSO57_1021414 [Entomophthora muscae]
MLSFIVIFAIFASAHDIKFSGKLEKEVASPNVYINLGQLEKTTIVNGRYFKPKAMPKMEPMMEPKMQPKMEPMMEPTMQPKMEPMMQSKMEPMMEPMMQSMMEPMMKPTMQPKMGTKMEPIMEPMPIKPFEMSHDSAMEPMKKISIAPGSKIASPKLEIKIKTIKNESQ